MYRMRPDEENVQHIHCFRYRSQRSLPGILCRGPILNVLLSDGEDWRFVASDDAHISYHQSYLLLNTSHYDMLSIIILITQTFHYRSSYILFLTQHLISIMSTTVANQGHVDEIAVQKQSNKACDGTKEAASCVPWPIPPPNPKPEIKFNKVNTIMLL